MVLSVRLRSWLAVGIAVVASAAMLGGIASANSKYAAFVMHADTGDVLFDRYSNEERYPASLTKMMTLYLLFEAIEREEISLTDKMIVSRRAALQPASKLGLPQGSTIDVETAIEALVIRSANDVATVVAERLSGSEAKFARDMTEKAHQLGMRRTTFRNASGLPDRHQVTTARDMAILSQRITQDFPRFFPYFDRTSFQWDGRTYRSHNRVAMNYEGADGLKTGYTRASGYNLATTAVRGEHRLIGVVLGGRSTATRDAHMREILDNAFYRIKRNPNLISDLHFAEVVPRLRPDRAPMQVQLLAAAVADTPVPRPKTLAIAEARSLMLEAANDDTPAPALALASLAPLEPVGEGDAEPAIARDWVIQVGAYREQPQAIARIRATQEIIRSIASQAGREVNIVEQGTKPVYRARFTSLTETEAQSGCNAVKARGEDCIAILVPR